MGVPGFFLWLWKKYRDNMFVFTKGDLDENETLKEKYKAIYNIDEFLIDANCLIHPQCYKVLAENKNWSNLDKLEKLMLDQVIKYIDHIIKFVNPKKAIYIAVDGVAPVAKIKQQRSRRFKSIKDKTLFDNIKKKHNRPIDNHWNNSSITPGSLFIQHITSKIINHIKEKKSNDYANIKIIFSSGNTPGEGEHKLLQHIRNKGETTSYAIYGLDADLIFLALSTQKDNIYLIREANQMDNVESDILNYVSIDIMKECIHNELLRKIDKKIIDDEIECVEMNNMINDFIFICYFLGNDFLPHIPSIDIKNQDSNGLDVLLDAYIHTINNVQTNVLKIGDQIQFNDMFMLPFLEYLSFKEVDFFSHLNKKKRVRPCDSSDPYDLEMHRIDNLLFPINDPIELGKNGNDTWKFNYYNHYFNVTINQPKFVNNLCHNYFIGLVWIAHYYFDECASWRWYYPFDHAPFISDLVNNIKDVNFNEIKFEKGEPVQPFVQLMSVLPPQSSYLLPSSYKELMLSDKSELIHLYPTGFELDMIYKRKYWECIPILPSIDIDAIIKATNDKKLTKDEQKRNQLDDVYVF